MTAGLPLNARSGSRFLPFSEFFSRSKTQFQDGLEPLAHQGVEQGRQDVAGRMAFAFTPGQNHPIPKHVMPTTGYGYPAGEADLTRRRM
jgi:hypothetical protein